MPPTELDLDRIKNECLDYMRTVGVPIFYSTGCPEQEDFTFWDAPAHPDWRQFIDVARECGVQLLTFSSTAFAEEDVTLALDRLEDASLGGEERADHTEAIESLRPHCGQTGWVRIAFDHQGRWFAYERTTSWYERFRDLMEDLNEFLPYMGDEDEEDEGSRGGFFSPN